MRHRIVMLAMALMVVLGTGVAVATGPAQASQGPRLLLYTSVNRCIVAQGAGNQVAIKDPAGNYCARFTFIYIGMNFELQDGNGNCLRANSASQVKIENGGCNSTDLNEQWYSYNCNAFSCNYVNVGRNAYLKTNGTSSGDLVYVGLMPGGYFRWNFG